MQCYFREILCFLSTAAAVGLMLAQIKSAVENNFPGETRTPPCSQHFSTFLGIGEGKMISYLAGPANVHDFSEATTICICLDLFCLMLHLTFWTFRDAFALSDFLRRQPSGTVSVLHCPPPKKGKLSFSSSI